MNLSSETQATKNEISNSLEKMKDSTSKVEILVTDFTDITSLVKDVNEKMDNLLKISQQNTASMEEIDKAIKELDASINKLDKVMQAYRT
jgi:methyl-accepting chemotaxis protein